MFDEQKLLLLLSIKNDPKDGIRYSEVENYFWLKDYEYIEYNKYTDKLTVTAKGINFIKELIKRSNA